MKRRVIIFVVFVLLSCIPIFLWGNFYYVGGDDSKLYYLFPFEYFQNFTLHIISDNQLGALGNYIPQAYISGFSLIITLVKALSPFVNTQQLFFGMNLAVGFVSFYLLLGVWLRKDEQYNTWIKLVSSLAYTFSTFTFYTVWSSQLFSVYLISIFPLCLFLFLKGLYTKQVAHIILSATIIAVFSIVILSAPWAVALIISVFPLIVFLAIKLRGQFFKYTAILFVLVFLLNFHWLVHFLYAPYSSDKSMDDWISSTTSVEFRNEKRNIIEDVSKHNQIAYPFLGLFHKNIQEDFHWYTYEIFSSWHMRWVLLDGGILLVIVLGLIYTSKTTRQQKHLYFSALISWLSVIFLFTVNVGDWGIRVFTWFSDTIPGFIMFKNMFDKFGLAMAFSYAFVLAMGLKIIFDSVSNDKVKKYLLTFMAVIIMLNAKPFILGEFYEEPLWTTKHTYARLNDFNEDFYALIGHIKNMNEPSRFLWLPLNNANYIQIRDAENLHYYYSGVSPLRFLANANDFNGYLSFPAPDNTTLFDAIKQGEDEVAGEIFKKYNVQYIILNRDISYDLQQSYLYGRELYDSQMNRSFMDSVLGDKVVDFGDRYSLYAIHPKFFSEKIYLTGGSVNTYELDFEKKASYEYTLSIRNLQGKKRLIFLDPYHKQWELYFSQGRIPFLTGSQDIALDYANSWTIDPAYIKQNFPKDSYSENLDGSIDLDLTLYFKPQSYFYLGLIISGITLLGCVGYLSYIGIRNVRERRRKWKSARRESGKKEKSEI